MQTKSYPPKLSTNSVFLPYRSVFKHSPSFPRVLYRTANSYVCIYLLILACFFELFNCHDFSLFLSVQMTTMDSFVINYRSKRQKCFLIHARNLFSNKLCLRKIHLTAIRFAMFLSGFSGKFYRAFAVLSTKFIMCRAH